MYLHANYWADRTLHDWARDTEVPEEVLDEVGPHHLRNMHITGRKTKRADAPWSQQKKPCKKIQGKKTKKLVAVAAEHVQEGHTHWEN